MEPRILLLADISSAHIEKWVVALAQKGYQIGIFSLTKSHTAWYSAYKNIEVLYEGPISGQSYSILTKVRYLFALPKLWSCIKSFSPTVMHAHYATSYGLLGALSKSVPFIISAWGSDIYEFPKKSFLHRTLLKFNLRAADKILSTSYVMKGELWKYSHKEIEVVPFGVETDVFYPYILESRNENIIHIGTIKAMEDIYGIKTIIEAIDLVKHVLPETDLKVFFIGGGNKTKHYKKLVSSKKLEDTFIFTGRIPHSDITDYHNLLDILLNVSTVDESFGVSVIEGMACEKAVIVSDAPGLKEVIGNCGIVVEKKNETQLAEAIVQLIQSPELRTSLGKAARKHVLKNYDFKNCLRQMEKIYNSFVDVSVNAEPAGYKL